MICVDIHPDGDEVGVMSDGTERSDVAYVWPETLRRPPSPPQVVYLDLNHWIDLAKAMVGHPDGENFRWVLDRCVDFVNRGVAVFPISDTIYFEISKIGRYRQRRHLRDVVELISRYMVVTSRPVVSVHEIEAILDSWVGANPDPINKMDYLDWGAARAFGRVGGFQIKSNDGADVTAETRLSYPGGPAAFDSLMAEAELELNRRVIDGPTPEEEPELRGYGWDPTVAFEGAKKRAEQEIAQVKTFNENPKWRRGRIRDVVAAREILIEINAPLFRGLAERGAELEDVFPRPETVRRAFDSMPSFDVAVTLKTSLHKNPKHQWKTNDISDIDALGSTLPYCDVVVTDAAMASHVLNTGLADRLNTRVLSRLSELPKHFG